MGSTWQGFHTFTNGFKPKTFTILNKSHTVKPSPLGLFNKNFFEQVHQHHHIMFINIKVIHKVKKTQDQNLGFLEIEDDNPNARWHGGKGI
jgi:hypothetical protein